MSEEHSYLDPYDQIEMHGWTLPHWEQGAKQYFVTWRLADALPAPLVEQWQTERKSWMRAHPKPWSPAIEQEYYAKFYVRIGYWLDQGAGSCLLRKPEMGQIVADALHYFDAKRYELDSFVIMPNHVHVLFAPMNGHKLSAIIGSWKSFTAFQINRSRGKCGQLWQENYWDRIIRNERHFFATRDYIERNPAKARLQEGEYTLYQAECR